MEKRKVKLFKRERSKSSDGPFFVTVEAGEGLFVQYGVSYDEFDTGVGSYSTAIVEMPDGTVRNIEVELIQFIEPVQA